MQNFYNLHGIFLQSSICLMPPETLWQATANSSDAASTAFSDVLKRSAFITSFIGTTAPGLEPMYPPSDRGLLLFRGRDFLFSLLSLGGCVVARLHCLAYKKFQYTVPISSADQILEIFVEGSIV
jgi:hypothetical protein